jgi:hypothetical protein
LSHRFDADLVDTVSLGQSYADVFAAPRRYIAPNVISSDRQLPMAAIHQYGEADCARSSKITKSV